MEFVFGNGELLVIECGTTEERNIIVERKGNSIESIWRKIYNI